MPSADHVLCTDAYRVHSITLQVYHTVLPGCRVVGAAACAKCLLGRCMHVLPSV